VGAVTNVVGACASDSLVVVGSGGVGLAAVMGAKLAGASTIIAIDLDPRKLDLAQRFGATHVVDARAEDVVAMVHGIVAGGVDWVIEAVGRPATLRSGVDMLAPEGTLVAVGLGSVGQTFDVPINELVQRQKRIVGSLYGSSNPHIDIPRILGLYESGRLPLDDLIGERYPLEAVNEAFDGLRDGAVGRAIIVPSQEGAS
jgi:Zn-dependent alcohol dehydrogenase